MKLSRRGFIVSAAAAGAARGLPQLAAPKGRYVLTLVYDKGLRAMRAIDKWVPF